MKLTLYYAPIACSLVPLITLNESGAPFDVHTVLLAKGQQKTPEYLKLNPKGKVPALAIDGDVLTENVAILSWIAGQFPERHLLPTEPRAAAKALSMMAFCASGIHPHLGRANAPLRFCDHPGSEDATRRLAIDEVLKAFAVVNDQLVGQTWACGSQWSAVDAYLFWVWRRAGQLKIDLSAFSALNAHCARMGERESVKKALAFEAETLAKAA